MASAETATVPAESAAVPAAESATMPAKTAAAEAPRRPAGAAAKAPHTTTVTETATGIWHGLS
jgi:hypothetical protein